MTSKCKRKHKTSGHRDYRRVHKNLKNRVFDRDQVVSHVRDSWSPELDAELPGGGEFYCSPCSRHFVNSEVLEKHNRSKPHKRKMKEVEEDTKLPYTSREADEFAGITN